MRDVVFILAWLALLPFAFRGVAIGVMLWAWTSLLAPNDLLFGMGVSVPFAKLAAIPTLLGLLARRKDSVRFRLGRSAWLMIGLGLLGIISQSLSPMRDTDPGWTICFDYLKVLALGLIIPWVIDSRLKIHGVLMAVCLGIGYVAVDEGVKFILSGSAHKVLGSASIGDNNQVALSILMIMPILHYLHGAARARPARLLYAAGLTFCVVTVIATFSRGGAVGLVLVAVASVLTSRRKASGIVMLVVAGVLVVSLVGPSWFERMNSITTADDDSSMIGRVIAWKTSTALAIDRPLLGGGFHAIQHQDVWSSEAAGYAALSFIPTGPQLNPRAAHSIYFEILGDLGFPGLLLFCWLILGGWVDGWAVGRMVTRSGQADNLWAADLAAKLRVSLLAFMVSGAALSAAYRDIDYILIALLTSLRQTVAAQEAKARDEGARPVGRGRRGMTRAA